MAPSSCPCTKNKKTPFTKVDHTYHDYSRYLNEGGVLAKHKKSHNNFPRRLHTLVSERNHSGVITWMPHGRAFKILNRERLVSEVIGNYFAHAKYESFTRQLNGWGFKRLHQKGGGGDEGAYYHEAFLRGMPQLTCFIRRLPPSAGGKPLPSPDKEPRFYEMTPLPMASPSLVLPKSSKACSASKAARRSKPSRSESRSKVRIKIQSAPQGVQNGEDDVNSGKDCSNVARSIVSASSSMPSWEDMSKVMMPVDDPNANAATRECWECFSFYCNC